MLFWENEYPGKTLEVHHLLVLSYYLQHPSLYSPEGLKNAVSLLVEFVEGGTSPGDMRRRQRDVVDSGKRTWKVTSTPNTRGAYARPPSWTLVMGDVAARGVDRYADSVRDWARSILDALKASGNLPAQGA